MDAFNISMFWICVLCIQAHKWEPYIQIAVIIYQFFSGKVLFSSGITFTTTQYIYLLLIFICEAFCFIMMFRNENTKFVVLLSQRVCDMNWLCLVKLNFPISCSLMDFVWSLFTDSCRDLSVYVITVSSVERMSELFVTGTSDVYSTAMEPIHFLEVVLPGWLVDNIFRDPLTMIQVVDNN